MGRRRVHALGRPVRHGAAVRERGAQVQQRGDRGATAVPNRLALARLLRPQEGRRVVCSLHRGAAHPREGSQGGRGQARLDRALLPGQGPQVGPPGHVQQVPRLQGGSAGRETQGRQGRCRGRPCDHRQPIQAAAEAQDLPNKIDPVPPAGAAARVSARAWGAGQRGFAAACVPCTRFALGPRIARQRRVRDRDGSEASCSRLH
mmetsp:Transcript_25974/g.69248  ORF Transcript_25974/g.69248 Transcript_25974/m.69248 type:complete len:204 (+) Transcript_25974:603-1214(+)